MRRERGPNENSMKKESTNKRADELRPEYDLSRLPGGIRGKYHRRATAGTNLVLIEPVEATNTVCASNRDQNKAKKTGIAQRDKY